MTSTPTTERAWLRGKYEAVELTPEASARRYARSPHPDTAGWLRVTSEAPAPRAIFGLGVVAPSIAEQAPEGAERLQHSLQRRASELAIGRGYVEARNLAQAMAFCAQDCAHILRQVEVGVRLQRGQVVEQRAAPHVLVIDQHHRTVVNQHIAAVQIAVLKGLGALAGEVGKSLQRLAEGGDFTLRKVAATALQQAGFEEEPQLLLEQRGVESEGSVGVTGR